jgi:hypothetical protein
MSIQELTYNGEKYKGEKDILKILKQEGFHWLIDSEVSEAVIEIKKNTLIWHSGLYLSGDWYYGIFKDGHFFGNWLNGIFENGHFGGNWNSGINLSKKINNL